MRTKAKKLKLGLETLHTLNRDRFGQVAGASDSCQGTGCCIMTGPTIECVTDENDCTVYWATVASCTCP